jgi:hypothetical protein
MDNFTKIMQVSKLNCINITTPIIIAGVTAVINIVQHIVQYIIAASRNGYSETAGVSGGNAVFIFIILAAAFIPSYNFRRIVNLGGRRNMFFWGTLATYAILSLVSSLIGIIVLYTFDMFIQNSGYFTNMDGIMNYIQVFGWADNGFFIAFLQQAAALFLTASFVHTLISLNDKWYGWVADALLIALIATFTPIAALRSVLVWFFNLILFHDIAFVQIIVCVALGLGIYMVNKPIYNRKAL